MWHARHQINRAINRDLDQPDERASLHRHVLCAAHVHRSMGPRR
jgi:hypothetical protein